MYVKHSVLPGQVTFISLITDLSVDLAINAQTPTTNVVSIESEEIVLTYDS